MKTSSKILWQFEFLMISLLLLFVIEDSFFVEYFKGYHDILLRLSACSLIIVYLTIRWYIGSDYSLSITNLFLVLFIGYTALNILFSTPDYLRSNRFLNLLLFYLVFISISGFFKYASPTLKMGLVFVYILVGTLQAIKGLKQFFGYQHSNHFGNLVTGDFFNPAPFSGYLLTIFPIALVFYLRDKDRNIQYKLLAYLGLFSTLLMFFLLPATNSRASWVATAFGLFVVFWYRYKLSTLIRSTLKSRNIKLIVFIIIAVVILASIIGLFYYKKASALGRLLAYEVSLLSWVEHPIVGYGYNLYSSAFGQEQIEFFSSEPRSEEIKLVAGYGEYAFNEYLLILVEQGFVGFVLFLGVAFSSSMPIGLRYTHLFDCQIRLGALAALGALMVFAFFSYPFSIDAIYLHFFFLIGILDATNPRRFYIPIAKFSSRIQIFGIICCLILSTVLAGSGLEERRNKLRWERANFYYDAKQYPDAVRAYEEISTYFASDGNFLFEYGQALKLNKNYVKAALIFERATKFTTDPYIYNSLGECYQKQRDYKKAEESYYKSHYLVPHKFFPVYLLANLFLEKGDTIQSKKVANELLSMPIKVHSSAIDEMRADMNKILNY